MWYVWLQNEPLFELKELSKEEGKQNLNGKKGGGGESFKNIS